MVETVLLPDFRQNCVVSIVFSNLLCIQCINYCLSDFEEYRHNKTCLKAGRKKFSRENFNVPAALNVCRFAATFLRCGRGEIRTRAGVTLHGFQDRAVEPLRHPSAQYRIQDSRLTRRITVLPVLRVNPVNEFYPSEEPFTKNPLSGLRFPQSN